MLLLLNIHAADAGPPQPAPLPPPPPAPIVGLRIIGPPGSQAAFYPEPGRVQGYDTPATVSVRPGYIYRFRLGNLPQGKEAAIYPTIEVIGSLHLPHVLSGTQFPVPVVISADDVERVLAGAYITKLIVLENPERASPVATQASEPLETRVHPHRNLLEEGWEIGRPMVVIRLGERQASPQETMSWGIPGTMLLDGEPYLGPATAGPTVPYQCFRVTDPLHGLRYDEEEVIKDGGDVPPKAALDRAGQLHGLDPKDTVAEYGDSRGQRQVAVSNRVCLLAPRYAVFRTEVAPAGVELTIGPAMTTMPLPPLAVESRLPSLVTSQLEGPEIVKNSQRPAMTQEAETALIFEQLLGTGLIIGSVGPKVVINTSAEKCPSPPEKPLYLCKLADRQIADVGAIVTFTLRYHNPGGQPISDIVVSDSLTSRLEYIPGSQQSDREAVFTTQQNPAGSLILRWELPGKLQPGDQGAITFQARIR